MTLGPEIEGTLPIRSPPAQFLNAFRNRVAAGLLWRKPHPRSNYLVTAAGPAQLRIHAADWWTAINVGLNELELHLPQSHCVQYRVRYWRWSGYVLGLSAVLGLIGLFLLLAVDARGYIARNPFARYPGLSIDQSLFVAWAMVLFWGFVWPWLLIAFHKRPLRRLVALLIAEVDADGSRA